MGNINLEIDDNNDNYINIDYLDKNNENIEKNKNDISSNSSKIGTNKNDISSNLEKINTNENYISSNSSEIDTNKNDISTNLIGINTNEDNIAYNLCEINYIKNNISKPYLKNKYNILFYDSKTQIDFRNLFYEKVSDINSIKNDFLEISLKFELQYQDTDDRNYVKKIYEIFVENDNSLYIKSVTNNNYIYFSNRIIAEENIFNNFIKNVKKIKFVIKFQMLLPKVIKIWYIKNDNYRLIIKNYGL